MSANWILTNRSELFSWARGNSLWTYNLGLSCCGMEFLSATSPRYDWERFGATVKVQASDADLLIIGGPVNHKMAEDIKRIYEQMPDPKYVISMGSCANSGGMFAIDNDILGGIDKIIPVDIYIPGCPPRPESLIHALIRLQERLFHA
jgi:NADH-quinone oxidoreductase subunit B